MKNVGAFAAFVIAAAMMFGIPAGAGGQDADLRAAKPKAFCMKYKNQRTFTTARPANCDFIWAEADLDYLTSWALIPTRSMRWVSWGQRSAYGKGKGFARGIGWRPNRIRLSRPRMVCGRKVFTRLRSRQNIPGQGWTSWGRKVPLMPCD